MSDYLVLSDDLFICYQTYNQQANPKSSVKKTYKKLLANYSAHKTNIDQLERCKASLPEEFYKSLKTRLLASSKPNQTLEELASETIFKIILTKDEGSVEPPYLNINNTGPLDKNYTVSYKPNAARGRLVEYISSLCEKASKVIICDKFLVSNWDGKTEKLFQHVLPRKDLNIYFVDSPDQKISDKFGLIKQIHSGWVVEKYSGSAYSHRSHHDRYLIVEVSGKTIEIMLSSGFSYLWDSQKEITCVFSEM